MRWRLFWNHRSPLQSNSPATQERLEHNYAIYITTERAECRKTLSWIIVVLFVEVVPQQSTHVSALLVKHNFMSCYQDKYIGCKGLKPK